VSEKRKLEPVAGQITLCPPKKISPEDAVKRSSSRLASFAQLQFNSMNICLHCVSEKSSHL